ncbi:MBL fold metallo-hydrolase [Salibaculum griseiflavum]|uniref:MBL fold metallo-hydrolase n=1 Tax=Salibaculum griseiflavum TaxID=1914409 RepID=A0A2V1P6N4_9RHOB|nr:MBL fold metallo-hydrolase [Salibaculum griseiflavum]PWG16892.1 MBL fold metallo-hydrolase [Salibaculum griseiflavum]
MQINRRTLLKSGTAALGATALPGWAHAQMTLGNVQIDTLSDGNLVLPREFQFGDLPQDEVTEILARYGITGDEMTPDCNVTLMRDGTNTVLFDVGAGPNFMPSAGTLWEALDELGVYPEDVTHVVFTHAHPDHLWGLLDDFDDLVFPEAQYMIGRAERDYWLDPATPDTIGEARLAFAAGAIRYLGAIEDRLTTFEDGEEILPGIAARATFGHTPGHMAFELRGGSESVMVLGDCIGNAHVAFERPGWVSGSDQDQEMGAATRVALLDQLANDQMPFIGFHMPYPGIGRAEKSGDSYRFVAA